MSSATTAADVQKELAGLGDNDTAQHSQRYFKTGPGEYAEGDLFRGIRVPILRRIAAKHRRTLSLAETERLLQAPFHEDRFVALVILAEQFKRAEHTARKAIFECYLANTQYINNWDLVDASAEHVVGAYLWDKDRSELYRLARSQYLWERRIGVMATFHYIKRGEFGETLGLAELLLGDNEDLIHKAVGWMLREIGKRDAEVAEAFLQKHYASMPRTMLRYAIEKFPEERRQRYLRGEI